MRIFLAGGAGALGRRIIPRLTALGHHVTATTRHSERVDILSRLGATPTIVDVYDADRLAAAVIAAAPDLILHELTDLSRFDRDANARLRREGTANLVAAAKNAGVTRIIVQSIAWVFPDGTTLATEEDAAVSGTAVDDMEQLAWTVPHATVLRYGMLYGPDTWYAPEGQIARVVGKRGLPATAAYTCFVHIDDAAAATVEALAWPDGLYQVVDDEPAPATSWLPVYARAIGAPEPEITAAVPGTPLGRPVSNAKARAAGWEPIYPTWREGFHHLTDT
ncbi:nucleoside-diphosphate-sugar epimerase [Antricoccus suffuscus]|uniref:Nucleoside-diphosphate-sugar epimerase n=1 Tax=Antricoccus suffuscus TaxID=1629062 RepID=A0A2T1A1G9_9ACTN|nr:NAD(P)H-binding protein [Antricoccus suffuscus]PRZ42337.1 nucleoside-diphosphate-sugar epimerase [Antricoccus suffuscus]